ncbi:TetR/AcrR family transcriptional regulator [Nocardia gipuzkoensis]
MTSPSTWGGRTVEARRAARRERLIDAAIDIWADSGWAAVSLRSVCARAGLNDRYFRESFADREELLAAAWDHVRDETTTTLIAAIGDRRDSPPLEVLHRAVEAMVLGFAEDPRRSQVLFGDHAGSEILERRRHDLVLLAADLLATGLEPYLRAGVDREEFHRTALMAVGGFVELTSAWRAGAVAIDIPGLIDQTIRLGDILAGHYLGDHPRS